MPLSAPLLVEISNVAEGNLANYLSILRGCWKSSSLLWMHVNEFPSLSGLVLGGWSAASEEASARFCREGNFSDLLVRIEKPGQRWTRRRGGYTVSLAQVQGLVRDLADEGMISILLEPASPCNDFFSFTSVCDADAGKADVEVVGPGFDASDVLRGDITPHERFEINLSRRSGSSKAAHRFQIHQTYLIDREGYQASVKRRLAKIGARLRNPSFPDEWMQPNVPGTASEGLIHDATFYLRETGQTVLLDRSDSYDPIPAQLLDTFLGQVGRLSEAVEGSKVPWRTFSLAASFLSGGRFVIWDFFPPGDHDTRTLAHLHVRSES